jgi:dATP pyrophosphohydrolase
MGFKIPQSVLVVIHTLDLDVLLLKRSDMSTWQSVTGSKDFLEESWSETARREVFEETGIDCTQVGAHLSDWGMENVYEIYPAYRYRYAPEVTHNLEHVFGLQISKETPIVLSPSEHTDYQWLPHLAAADQVFSPSNAEAILSLRRFVL